MSNAILSLRQVVERSPDSEETEAAIVRLPDESPARRFGRERDLLWHPRIASFQQWMDLSA